MTKLRSCDWNKVIDLDIAKELVDELGACEKDEAILEEDKQYALKIARIADDEDKEWGDCVDLLTLFDAMDYAFEFKDPSTTYLLRDLATA